MIYKYLAGAGVAIALVFVVYKAGVSNGVNKERVKWQAEQKVWLEDIVQLSEEMQERKREHDLIVSKLEENHLKEVRKIEQSKDFIIADYRAGNIKLRERFKRSSGCSAGADTAATGSSNAGSGSGFLNEDAEFLIRFAAQCDNTAKQLIAAQNYIRSLDSFR